ncbi:MAG: hypothetical protein ACO1G9_08145 [Bacteroidota bacterium]
MDNLSKFLRDINNSLNFSRGLGISSQLVEMARTHQVWKQNFSGFDMLAAAAREATRQHKTFTTAADIAMSLQHSIKLPQTAFDAFQSINHQHAVLFNGWRSISDVLSAGNSSHAWRNAINSLSSQVATLSAAKQSWDLIDDFKSISEEATNFKEKIVEQQYITQDDLRELKNIVERIETKTGKHDKNYITILYHYVFIVYAIIFIFSHILEWTNQEGATKEDVEKAKIEILTTLQHKIWQKKYYRSTLRPCKVFTKPNTKSVIVATLPKDCNLTIITSKHKWVLVTYINPVDGYPETGWVLKKYLSEQKYYYQEE